MSNSTTSPMDAMNQMANTATNNLKALMNSASSTKTISGGRRGRKGRRVKSKKSTKKHRRRTHHKKRKGFSFNLF